MGFADIDKKATEKYTPSPFLRKKAEKLSVNWRTAKSEDDLRRLITEAEKPKTEVAIAPSKVEVLKPSTTQALPNIYINIPIPKIDISATLPPQWWEMVAELRNATLYMIAGASAYSVITKLLGV